MLARPQAAAGGLQLLQALVVGTPGVPALAVNEPGVLREAGSGGEAGAGVKGALSGGGGAAFVWL